MSLPTMPLQLPRERWLRALERHVAVATLAGVAGALIAGCQTPPPAPPPAPVQAPPPPPVEPPPPPLLPAPPPPPPAAQQAAQKAALAAAEMLENGNEEAARAELKRALGLDFQNKLALNLTRQLGPDAVASLGRDSFSYTVRAGETLSKIAERFMQGDRYAFVILARYNNIAVPKQVSVGQVLKIPGKPPANASAPISGSPPPPKNDTRGTATTAGAGAAVRDKPRDTAVPDRATAAGPTPTPPPPAPPPPEPTPGEKALRNAQAAELRGDLATARLDYIGAAGLGQTGASAKAEQLGHLLTQRYATAAKGALAKQDLDGAIANWQRVLEIEPNNATARSEIERMRTLKKNLGTLK